MDFDWNKSPIELNGTLTIREIEESFEDPFAVKLLPDSPRFSVQSRCFNLGKANSGAGVFSVYRTNGKTTRVICARPFSGSEEIFYARKLKSALET